MFTVEIKINGSLISHIYGHNEGDTANGCKYRYEFYEVETRKVTNGFVVHPRQDGITELIKIILKDAKK